MRQYLRLFIILLFCGCYPASITGPDSIGKVIFDSDEVDGCDGKFESLEKDVIVWNNTVIFYYKPKVNVKISALAIEVGEIKRSESHGYYPTQGILIQINKDRSRVLWLDENFDRIVRDERELLEKMNYIVNNPLKAGLVRKPDDYKWLYYTGKDACATRGEES